MDDAEKIGAGLARTLTAAMVNDPLFGGDGTPVDPGLLLTPPPGKRARISVISLIGLPADDARQSLYGLLNSPIQIEAAREMARPRVATSPTSPGSRPASSISPPRAQHRGRSAPRRR